MLRFEPLVWVKDGPFNLREVDSVESAQDYLDQSPLEGRGPLFYATANTLASARGGSIPAEEARQAFYDYAEDAGILAESAQAE